MRMWVCRWCIWCVVARGRRRTRKSCSRDARELLIMFGWRIVFGSGCCCWCVWVIGILSLGWRLIMSLCLSVSDARASRRNASSTRRSVERRVCKSCLMLRSVSEMICSDSWMIVSCSVWCFVRCLRVRWIIVRVCMNNFFVNAVTSKSCKSCCVNLRWVGWSKSCELCRVRKKDVCCFVNLSKCVGCRWIYKCNLCIRVKICLRSSNNVCNKLKRCVWSLLRSVVCMLRCDNCWKMNVRCNLLCMKRFELWRRRWSRCGISLTAKRAKRRRCKSNWTSSVNFVCIFLVILIMSVSNVSIWLSSLRLSKSFVKVYNKLWA